jgi:hypothetical protein
MRKNTINRNWRTPPLTWCAYLILKKIASENGKLTPYAASQYAENLSKDQLEQCEKDYGTYNNMKRLLLQWEKEGIVQLKPINRYVRISMIEVLPSGLDLLKKLDDWYGTPNT